MSVSSSYLKRLVWFMDAGQNIHLVGATVTGNQAWAEVVVRPKRKGKGK